MALTVAEVREEQVAQLHRLALSPGWVLLATRLTKSVESSEAEKARLLREGDMVRAAAIQHRVDGIRYALQELDRYEQELRVVSPTGPAY